MRFSLILNLFMISVCSLSAQQIRPNFKSEIGFNIGTTLKYKGISMLIKTTAFNHSSQAPAWRLLGGYYQEKLFPFDFDFRRGDTLVDKSHSNALKYNYFFYSGLEFQKNKKRWRLYLGPELGYRYSFSHIDHVEKTILFSMDSVISTDSYRATVVSHSPRFTVFGGTQFFFTPHWSVGLELNADAGLNFDRVTNKRATGESHLQLWNFDLHLRLIRLIYLSYHFGRETMEPTVPDGIK